MAEVRTVEAGLRIVGQPVVRHDARDKVQAATAYAGDWTMAGMLHAVVVRSPYPSARIRRIDTTRSSGMKGVVAVLTAADVPRNTLWTDVPGQTTEVGPLRARLHVLAEDRVRHQGEPVALIAAETEEEARAASEAVDVDYEPLPGVFDPDLALASGAPLVHEGSNLLAHWRVARGDVDLAFTRAAVVVEGEYRTQFVDSSYLEPESGVAWLDSDGVITIRLSTQVIEHFRDVAEVLAVPQNRVRVIGTYLGGGFGGKEDVTVEVYLGLLVLRTGRPVKMVWTRQESLLARAKRHPVRHALPHGRVRLRRDPRPRHRAALRLRRLRLPLRPGAAVLHGDGRRALSGVERARRCPRGLHQQPAHQRHARLWRDADGLRLRVADGPCGARHRPRPGARSPAQRPPARRHAPGGAGDGDPRGAAGTGRARLGRPRRAARASRGSRQGGARTRLQLPALRAHRVAARLVECLGGLRDGRQPRRALRRRPTSAAARPRRSARSPRKCSASIWTVCPSTSRTAR